LGKIEVFQYIAEAAAIWGADIEEHAHELSRRFVAEAPHPVINTPKAREPQVRRKGHGDQQERQSRKD